MTEILVFGNINADRVIRLDQGIGPGRELSGVDLGLRLGGAAANAGSALAVAGNRVRLIGFVGSDVIGDALLRQIEACPWNWDSGAVGRMHGDTPSCLILIDPTGERTIVSLGHTRSGPTWPDVAVHGAACAYVGSRWPLSQDVIARLLAAEIPIVCQFKGADTIGAASIIVASRDHFSGPDSDDPWAALRDRGFAPGWLVVTQGTDGAFATDGKTRLHVPAETATVVDATGAGDAFAAGLVHGTARRWPMEACLALAARWGALAVAHSGSTFPPAEDAGKTDGAPAVARYPDTDRVTRS
ncbi:MAG: carbohydrate kinase family protein [Inquilinaceae bacterium]